MDDRDLKGKAAISGLGVTEMGRVYGHSAAWFAAEAVRLAVEDAGLRKDEIDGLLVNQGVTPLPGLGGLDLQNHLGLTNLRLLSNMTAGGATASCVSARVRRAPGPAWQPSFGRHRKRPGRSRSRIRPAYSSTRWR